MKERIAQTEEAILLLTKNLNLLSSASYCAGDTSRAEVTIKNQNQWAIDCIKASAKQ